MNAKFIVLLSRLDAIVSARLGLIQTRKEGGE